MKRFLPMAAAALALGSCATMPQPGGARAELRDISGNSKATASVSEGAAGLMVRLEARGMPQGVYGVHLHSVGRCDPPDFKSAGPHWNPTGRQHGRDNPLGMHMGDLPNLAVGSDGRGIVEFRIPDARLTGPGQPLLDADGAAVVIHAAADDYRTDPSGNSGARIACGVIR